MQDQAPGDAAEAAWMLEPVEQGEYRVEGIDRVAYVYREETTGEPWAVEYVRTDPGTLASELVWEPLAGRRVKRVAVFNDDTQDDVEVSPGNLWKVSVRGGKCVILDADGIVAHMSVDHQATAISLAISLARRAQLELLECALDNVNELCKDWDQTPADMQRLIAAAMCSRITKLQAELAAATIAKN